MSMWNKAATDYSLYLIADYGIAGVELLQLVQEALAGGVSIVQLRAKALNAREFCALGKEMLALTTSCHVPLIINDRVDIAQALGAAGVHLGPDDLPADMARKILGQHCIVGVSARTRAEARLAVQQGADYVGVGAVFPTATKADATHIGLTVLAGIVGDLSIPVLAIGGIDASNAATILDHGADGLCVASAILKAASPRLAAAEIRNLVFSRR
ncbi:MAG: Thiamine-phosphate synthase [Firmicutes bacterium]|nr:Thiamine-phosphate synthase [candidate division NPL-UPA2 bacterium]